jgi:mono/diheme cytochrome c family protein
VQVTVDAAGEHERYPQTNEEWELVWAAALSLAESGNLLMMTPRAVDDGAWMQFARSLIEAGVEAAAAAEAHDVDRVFAAGEQVYNVCLGCHTRYVPELRPLVVPEGGQPVSGEN